jgi:hypothetical protein
MNGAQPVRSSKKESQKGRKIGRKHRNGKPFGRNGDCGCITCRAGGRKMC